MKKKSTHTQTRSMSELGGLDEHRDSAARSSTSLFRLLSSLAADAQLLDRGEVRTGSSREGEALMLWSNRPGQNATEANFLALLSTWLVGAIMLGATVHFLGRSWWAWPTAILTTPILTFLTLQIFSIIVALFAGGIRKLGVGDGQNRERRVLFVSLFGLTLLALLALSWGGPIYLAAAVPWLLWSALNFFAWIALLLKELMAALR